MHKKQNKKKKNTMSHLLEELSTKLGTNRVTMKVQTNEYRQGEGNVAEPLHLMLQPVDLMDEAKRGNHGPKHNWDDTDLYTYVESIAARQGYVVTANASLKDRLLQHVLSMRSRFKSDAQTALHANKPHEAVLKAFVSTLQMSVVWQADSAHDPVFCIHEGATLKSGTVLVIVPSSAPRIVTCLRMVLLEEAGHSLLHGLGKSFLLRFSMADLKDMAGVARLDIKGIKKKDALADLILGTRSL
jgi:hypothetical protein